MRSKYHILIGRLLPERELYYRSAGRVRFVRLKTPAQLAILAVLLAGTGWVSFSSTNLIVQDRILAAKDRQIERVNAAYDGLSLEFAETYRRFEAVTAELESKHLKLRELVRQRAALETKVGALKRDLDRIASERNQALAAERLSSGRLATIETELEKKNALAEDLRQGLAGTSDRLAAALRERDTARREEKTAKHRIETLQTRLARLRGTSDSVARDLASTSDQLRAVVEQRDDARRRNLALTRRVDDVEGELQAALDRANALNQDISSLTTRLAKVTDERDGIRSESRSLTYRVSSLISNLGDTSAEKSRLEKDLIRTTSQLENALHDRDSIRRRNEILADRVRRLDGRLLAIREGQKTLIARIQDRTEGSIQALEQTIALTGLDVDQIIRDVDSSATGQGGPLINLGADASDTQQFIGMVEGFEDSLARLETHILRWDGLREILKRLPLSRPVDSSYVTSGFGKRRDPITRRWAMHHGVDYAGHRRAPILSTAPGVVAFAGRDGPYGRAVVIDHGYGFKTKYGHLAKVLVKRGQKVSFRQKIGLMGTSGRSTGRHLHYEILYKGRPQSPARFIQAGKHVFKG